MVAVRTKLLVFLLCLCGTIVFAGGPSTQTSQDYVDTAISSVTTTLGGKLPSTFGTLGQVAHYEWANIASGAAVPLESIIGAKTAYRGTLRFTVLSGGQLSAASYQIKGDINAAVELYDPDNAYTAATGGVTLNLIPDGDGTYTLQNCIGAGLYLEIEWFGWK